MLTPNSSALVPSRDQQMRKESEASFQGSDKAFSHRASQLLLESQIENQHTSICHENEPVLSENTFASPLPKFDLDRIPKDPANELSVAPV